MYLGNMSGYGTKDFNKALKGTNIAAIQKGIDVQRAQLAKSKKPKDIARNQAQLAAAEQRMAEVLAAQSTPAITPAPPPESAPDCAAPGESDAYSPDGAVSVDADPVVFHDAPRAERIAGHSRAGRGAGKQDAPLLGARRARVARRVFHVQEKALGVRHVHGS
jgi:hypothetical protein